MQSICNKRVVFCCGWWHNTVSTHRCTLFILMVTIFFVHSLNVKDKTRVVANDGYYYLIYPNEGYYRSIPNVESAKVLIRAMKDGKHVFQDEILARESLDGAALKGLTYKEYDPIPSLAHANNSPDEMMRVMVQKILALSPTPYWKESMKFPHRLNPAIEVWHNKTLMISRPGLYDSDITVYWLSQSHDKVDRESTHLGIGYGIPFRIKVHDFNQLREDPRIFALSNGTLVVLYTSKESLFQKPMQCYFTVHVNDETGLAEISDSVRFDTTTWKSQAQKNWTPLEYNNRLLFISNINPTHIVEYSGEVINNQGLVKTVFSHSKKINLPWKAEYGLPLCGGTPAILVRGVYLAFFHTVSHFHAGMRTYFMGAITFCPVFPFRIHSVSPHPILNESMYEVAWAESKSIDYVAFPIGLVIDPNDTDYVLLSLGHQDKDGYILRLEIEGLYRSMEQTHNCSTTTSTVLDNNRNFDEDPFEDS